MDDYLRKGEFRFHPNQYPLSSGLRLIEASAGTGKTFALSHLVLRLITEAQLNIKEILVVTFTDSAASELRGRICRRLESALDGLEAMKSEREYQAPDAVLAEWLEFNQSSNVVRSRYIGSLLEALEGLESADITTIHGFCRRTLTRDVLESPDVINPVMEGEGKELAIEVCHDYWHQQILEMDVDDFRGLNDAGITLDNLIKLVLKLDNDPSLGLEVDDECFDVSEKVANQFINNLENRWNEFLSEWCLKGKELELSLRSKSQQWRSWGCIDTKPFSPKPRKNRYELLDNWIKEISSKNNNFRSNTCFSYGLVRDQDLLVKYYHPAVFCEVASRSGDDQFQLICPKLQKAIASLVDDPAEQVWRHALQWCLTKLEERRRTRGAITYSGLLKVVDQGLNILEAGESESSNQSNLLNSIRLRYRAALVDEFQDTDPLQWRILTKAFADSKSHLLLMVGDPKQAIYRFRGGSLGVYMNVREKVDRIDVLLENFRTTPDLMRSLNSLFSTGLRYSDLHVPSLNSSASEENIFPSSSQKHLQLITFDSLDGEKSNIAETSTSKTKLEERIPLAVSNAVLDLLNFEDNRLSPNDICLLVSRHDQANDLRIALGSVGLPTRLVSSGDVFQSEAAYVLQCFLDCIARPGHSGSLRLVACSALYQWNASMLEEAEKNGGLDGLAQRFSYLARNFSRLGLLGCLAEDLESWKIADLSDRGRLLGDLQQCAQLVQEAIHVNAFDPASAAVWLRRERLQPTNSIPENRQPQSDLEESAISIVTVHRSKGLEYKVVICPYLWQAPLPSKDPLLRFEKGNCWRLSLNRSWGKGLEAASEWEKASFQEAERLAYVAMTRARSLLILLWARGERQEGNPLAGFLFGPESFNQSIDNLSHEKMINWLNQQKVEITFLNANVKETKQRWSSASLQGGLSIGAVPSRALDVTWSRSSYSSWTRDKNSCNVRAHPSPIELEDGRDSDQSKDFDNTTSLELLQNESASLPAELQRSQKGPLCEFPQGSIAGDCLHRILERLDFRLSLKNSYSVDVIEEELRRVGFHQDLLPLVQEGLGRVLNIPMGGVLGDLKFNQLTQDRRIHELSFDIPIAHEGSAISSSDLSRIFKEDSSSRFSDAYAASVSELNFLSSGFLTGSIDLVFADHADPSLARWWVADWKSNWIGQKDEQGKSLCCGPFFYSDEAMERQMLLHHYPLQAHIYLVALHRFLRWRLPNYDPKRNLGGYLYVFLRGIPDINEIVGIDSPGFVPGFFMEQVSLSRILLLDSFFREGQK